MALPAFLARALEFMVPPATTNDRQMPVYAPVSKVQGITPEDPFRIQDRLSKVHTARALYQLDGRYKAQIDYFVDAVVRAGFSFESDVADPDQMMALSEQYHLPQQLGQWLRNLFLDGDLFLYIMLNETEDRIAQFYPLPATHMRRNSDGYDLFPNPQYAFSMLRNQEVIAEYAVDDYQQSSDVVNSYNAYQVLHIRWMRTEGRQRYGTPLLAAVHNALQRAIRAEANIDIRRQVHGSLRLWHRFVKSVPPEQRNKYIDAQMQNAKDLRSPMYQNFTGDNVEISVLPGDSNLHEFGDAAYQLEAFFAGCPVPKSVLGYADNINRDIFKIQQQEYISKLESTSEFVAQEILAPIMSFLLLYENRADVSASEIRCTFGSRAVFNATDFLAVADALSKLPAGTLAREDATRLLASQLDKNPEELLDRIAMQEMNDAMTTVPDQAENPAVGEPSDMTM